MKVTYHLNRRDLTRGSAFAFSPKTIGGWLKQRPLVILYMVLMSIGFFMNLRIILMSEDWKIMLLDSLPPAVLALLIQFLYFLLFHEIAVALINTVNRYGALRKIEKNGGVICEHTIEINEEFVIESTDINESRLRWRSIETVEENKDYIFIKPPGQAHIIPKRAFPNEEDAKKFYSQASVYLESAKSLKKP